MRYVRFGFQNSQDEEIGVCHSLTLTRSGRRWLTEFGTTMNDMHAGGFAAVERKWIRKNQARFAIFTGRLDDPTTAGCPRLWAAVSLTRTGQLDALLKIVGNYDGLPSTFDGHRDNALERMTKGTFF